MPAFSSPIRPPWANRASTSAASMARNRARTSVRATISTSHRIPSAENMGSGCVFSAITLRRFPRPDLASRVQVRVWGEAGTAKPSRCPGIPKGCGQRGEAVYSAVFARTTVKAVSPFHLVLSDAIIYYILGKCNDKSVKKLHKRYDQKRKPVTSYKNHVTFQSLTTFRAQKSDLSISRPMKTFTMSMNCTNR